MIGGKYIQYFNDYLKTILYTLYSFFRNAKIVQSAFDSQSTFTSYFPNLDGVLLKKKEEKYTDVKRH